MPRDSSRRPARHALRHRASSPVTALTAFSALVVVSVAVSAGITPEAGGERAGSAFGAPAASEERAEQRDSGWSLLAAGQQQTTPPAGPLRNERTASPVQDGGAGKGSWREGTGRGDGGRQSASTVRPGRQAPKLYQGELPVNTIIAPARPGAVLPGGQFGWRIAPDRGGREFHNGTDVSAAAGLPVVAALDGVVTAVFWDVWGGNRVEVTHADGIRTTYSHLEDVRVRTGDRLAASEQLGTVGATGVRVTGPHLHFETWVDGQAVDPQSFDWVDGMRVIPASRSKYSLEVPVPDDEQVAAAPKEAAGQKTGPGEQSTQKASGTGKQTPKAPTPPALEKTSPTTPRPTTAPSPAAPTLPVPEKEPKPSLAPAAPHEPTTPADAPAPAPSEPAPSPTPTMDAPKPTGPIPGDPQESPQETPRPDKDPALESKDPGSNKDDKDSDVDGDGDGTACLVDADRDEDGKTDADEAENGEDQAEGADEVDGATDEDECPAPRAASAPATGPAGAADPAGPAGAAGAPADAVPAPAAGADGAVRP